MRLRVAGGTWGDGRISWGMRGIWRVADDERQYLTRGARRGLILLMRQAAAFHP